MSYTKYKKVAIQSASREKILLMLYEGAIRFLKVAAVACEKKDIPVRCENIGRAYDIVLELMNTLNLEVGGKTAENLQQLYMFITNELTHANITGKVEHINNSLKILENLYDGWKTAIEEVKKNEMKSA